MKQESEIEEKELARLCSKGDNLARKELYMRYATRIAALCYRYVHDKEKAQDLMHDTMIKAYKSIGNYQYKGTDSLYAWIRGIAIKTAVDRFRKDRHIHSIDLETLFDPDDLPTKEEIGKISMSELKQLIKDLPDRQRMIFNMFCIDECSHKEISRRMGITEKTSSSLLSKAKKTLGNRIMAFIKSNDL